MPWPQLPVPAALTERAFAVAEGHALGLTPDALRNTRFTRPFRGVRALASDGESRRSPAHVARTTALHLVPRLRPGEAFSHTTALFLLGCPIRAGPRPHLVIPRPASRTVVRGVVGHTCSTPIEYWKLPGSGAPVVSPARAFVQSAALLPLRELIVAADHLVRPRRAAAGQPFITLSRLRAAADAARVPGAVRARAALAFAVPGAESRMETLLRLITVAFGIDVFTLQVNVYDVAGAWIGRFDMAAPEHQLLVEYDGEQHRTSDAQYVRDAERLDAAREAGFRVLRFRREEVLRRPEATARRIAKALGHPLRPSARLRTELLGEG